MLIYEQPCLGSVCPKERDDNLFLLSYCISGFLVRRLSIAKQNFAKLFILLYEKIDSGIDPWLIACS